MKESKIIATAQPEESRCCYQRGFSQKELASKKHHAVHESKGGGIEERESWRWRVIVAERASGEIN